MKSYFRIFKCKTSDEIKKRIDVFSSNWTKLNPKVKERMSILAKGNTIHNDEVTVNFKSLLLALEANELSKADEVHVNLVLDFPSEVINWMVSVYQLPNRSH